MTASRHVEAVCLLSRMNTEKYINVDISLNDIEPTAAESKATYDEIIQYIKEQFGLNVSNLYIAQIKRKYGIIEISNYNLSKSDNSKQPQCPPDKGKAIVEALK